MASATKHNRIADHAAQAGELLSVGKVFEAERHALKALLLARQDRDFQGMAAIVPCLMEARMKRLRDAMKVTKINIVETPVPEDANPKRGCHLVQPPSVGADARRLRLSAFERGVCVAVLCREPLTQLKRVPVVAITPGMTLRTQVDPPRALDKPDIAWFAAAIEALGDDAIDSLDPDLIPQRRVEALLERLDALPEHEGLHHALAQACLDAHEAEVQAQAARAAKKAARPQAAIHAAAADADSADLTADEPEHDTGIDDEDDGSNELD
jgi:hypothetical protein